MNVQNARSQPMRLFKIALNSWQSSQKNWTKLQKSAPKTRKIALVLANYPNKDGRLANGVGLDTPAAVVDVLQHLQAAGYHTRDLPENSGELMKRILEGPTNWLTDRKDKAGGVSFFYKNYIRDYNALPENLRAQIEDRWGAPKDDPFFDKDTDSFKLSIVLFGNVMVGIQPARGYNIDPTETYHAPDLVPPHNYLAFYFYIRSAYKALAIVHMGKHGNMEWLPGKSLALSEDCWPEAVFGPMPHLYPFIVNDPGEGTQAKRRSQAVIIDHLTPPLTRAETYGPLRQLEGLVDEYFEAAGIDARRIKHLQSEILSLVSSSGLDRDIGIEATRIGDDLENDLAKIDTYLCELKEAQIRDGLHIFGTSPKARLERDLCIALLRVPRASGRHAKTHERSYLRVLADELELGFDPLDCDMSQPWLGDKPKILHTLSTEPWRITGDTIERLELLAAKCVEDLQADKTPNFIGKNTDILHDHIKTVILPLIQSCGSAEINALLTGLTGKAIEAGPSGAPTRGRLDVLPTGRNFYSVDVRAVPSQTAWALGWKSADLLIERYLQDHGDWPKSMLITAWGTANMRTGGDDIAQALALMGVKPVWDDMSRRVTGFEIIPLSALGRPRVDVTLRISGFFRDAFPQLIALIDSASRAIQECDEPIDQNPAAANYQNGMSSSRVYGSKPGAYGAGLQAMIDEQIWQEKADLGAAYIEWGSYAYGATTEEGQRDEEGFKARLKSADAIVQNQDNREHDILDSDDYYQFDGLSRGGKCKHIIE